MSAPVLKVPFFSPALTQPGDFSGGRCISPFHRPRYKVSGFSPAGASAQASPARSNPIFRCSSTCTLRRMGPSSCVTASPSTRVITRGGVCPQVDTTRVRFANCQCFVAAVCQQNLEPGLCTLAAMNLSTEDSSSTNHIAIIFDCLYRFLKYGSSAQVRYVGGFFAAFVPSGFPAVLCGEWQAHEGSAQWREILLLSFNDAQHQNPSSVSRRRDEKK